MKVSTDWILKIMILSLVLTGCRQQQMNTTELKKPQDVVNYCVDNAIEFDFDNTEDSINDEMINVLAPYKVVLVGEMHFVHEHQEMMGALLKRLHKEGFRYYLQEGSTSTGLMIDYYIKGKLEDLTKYEKSSDLTTINELRDFNRKLREEGREKEQISYIGFDLNHMRTEYETALKHIINIYQLPEKTFTFYNHNAIKIKQALDRKEINGLNDSQINELKYITEAEIKSAEILASFDSPGDKDFDYNREDFIESYVLKVIDSSKDREKIIINTGSWHAQLILYRNVTDDENFKWLGMRLKEYFKGNPNGLYSFSCNAYEGQFRYNLYSPDFFNYNADKGLKKGALIPHLMKRYKTQTVFLDFTTIPANDLPINIQKPHDMTCLPVNTQFNGMLVYPKASIPTALKYYEKK
ncbi:MAG: erythromycin esterase family protein [Epulopiscium sp.]|nr:erythromycin esterase family protein [Candidatus Epulonipiscium sp.]